MKLLFFKNFLASFVVTIKGYFSHERSGGVSNNARDRPWRRLSALVEYRPPGPQAGKHHFDARRHSEGISLINELF